MKQMKFKVTLSTDVVLNVKSATDGNNQTLDFIPGNNFLGIVAGRLYQKVDTQTAWTLFHSGKHPQSYSRRLYSIRIRVDKGDMAGRKKEESG